MRPGLTLRVACISAFVLVSGVLLSAASADIVRVDASVESYAFDEQPPRNGVAGPTGWGGSSWQGPATGKTNYHVLYTDMTSGQAVNLEQLFGPGHNMTIGDIESVSFQTNKATGIPDSRDWWLTIYTQMTGSDDSGSWYKSRLSAFPDRGHGSYSFTYDQWNLWSTDDAASSTNQLKFVDEMRTPTTYETLPELTDGTGRNYAPELILSFTLQTDSGWNGFDGYIDGLTITLKNADVGEVNMTPEPASLAFLSLGALLLARRARRRKQAHQPSASLRSGTDPSEL